MSGADAPLIIQALPSQLGGGPLQGGLGVAEPLPNDKALLGALRFLAPLLEGSPAGVDVCGQHPG